jgi:UDP-N-acetylmuramoyl-tripeptide--D-alanyl-D-alanine ligase
MTIKELYGEFVQSKGISTDTRQDVNGTIFFALKGEQFDGNRYVTEALKGGCRLAVTELKEYEGEAGVCYTPSALKLLHELAAHHRVQSAPRVLAITGSNGKTTTKELVSAVLSKKFRVLATKGNLNNHIGVPLTLLSLDGEEIAVVEMGANHPGEIQMLARIATPNMGLITNVGKAHLEGFGSLEGVLDAKGELYKFLSESGGKAIVDGEDETLLEKASETGVKVLAVGEGGALPVSVTLLEQSPYLELDLRIGDESHHINTRFVGAYNLQNIKLAAACGSYFGVKGTEIAEAIGAYSPENQRSQVVEGGRNRLILDSYNANPSSMREAVGGLTAYAGMSAMVILGDMAELGSTSLDEHRELVRWLETLSLKKIVLVGPQFSRVSEPSESLLVFSAVETLQAHLEQHPPRGYTILVKGSRVMGLERLTPLLIDK